MRIKLWLSGSLQLEKICAFFNENVPTWHNELSCDHTKKVAFEKQSVRFSQKFKALQDTALQKIGTWKLEATLHHPSLCCKNRAPIDEHALDFVEAALKVVFKGE